MSPTLSPCPVPSAHRRLMDCHDHWHAALDKYMEPDGFRLELNALIQNLRNVTWLLQKQKAHLPGFSDWYPKWQAAVKPNPVMGWIVKARNRIVKEADLELLSTARLTMTFDWMNGEERIFHVPPRDRPVDIAAMLLRQGVPPYSEGESTLTIERRWVDRLLPEWELLDAADHAYGELVKVLRAAHTAAGVTECNLDARKRSCVVAALEYPLDCTSTGVDTRGADFDLGSLTPYTREFRRIELNRQKAAKAAEKYGVGPEDHPEGDAIARVPGLFRLASRMLAKDGHAVQIAWFFRGEDVVDIRGTSYDDQGGKMLSMRDLARRVRTLGADGFVYISEMWTGKAPSKEQLLSGNYLAARDQPDRGEALAVTGITRDGRTLSAIAPFTRDAAGAIVIGEAEIESPSQAGLMSYRPIFQVWGMAEADPMQGIWAWANAEDAEYASDRDG